MAYLGSWKIDDVLTFTVQTHTPSTGADVDADADPTYRLYENETGTPIVTGTFSKLDDANTTGFYSEAVTLSAANGFEKGKCYNLRKTAVVGGVTGSEVDSFQIEAEVDANVVSDKTGYSLTQTFPSNFSSFAITAGGAVTVGTNNDKTGYDLNQAFPTNFANLTIDAGEAGGFVWANIKRVNDVTVDGDGQPGTEWGPA